MQKPRDIRRSRPSQKQSELPPNEGPAVDPNEEEGSSATRPGRRPGKLDESGARLDSRRGKRR